MKLYKTQELFDLSNTIAASFLEKYEYPWEALGDISNFILATGPGLDTELYNQTEENVWIAKDAKIGRGVHIDGPCIIGRGTEVRQCAFIRGGVLVGDKSVVGNSTELKNCILFNNVQVPHFNYVGDSILGYKAHLGAGSITSNVKSDKSIVKIKHDDGLLDTGRKKFGAMVGDYTEV